MFQVKTKSTKDLIKLSIKGDASIQNAKEFHQKVKSLLEEEKSIEIDTAEISFADLSFLQIIGAMYKSLHSRGLTLTFAADMISEPVKSVIRKTGFFHTKFSTLVPEVTCPFYKLI